MSFSTDFTGILVEVHDRHVVPVASAVGMQPPQVGGAVHPGSDDAGQVDQRWVVLEVQPRVPRACVGSPPAGSSTSTRTPRWGRNGTTSAEIWTRGDEYQRSRAGMLELERRPTLRRTPDEGEPGTELHEVVVRRLDGFGDEVVDDAPDIRQLARTGNARVAAVVVGHPPRPVQNARELVLLGHVVQQVPAQ